MPEPPGSKWRMFLVVLGIGAVCCSLPAIGLLVAVSGATVGLLTGALWILGGTVVMGGILVGVHVARRRFREAATATGPEDGPRSIHGEPDVWHRSWETGAMKPNMGTRPLDRQFDPRL